MIVRLGRVRADLTAALGPDWAGRIPTQRRARMVARWWRGRLPTVPEPRLRQDVAFATVPGTGRQLLCDLWQPPADVPASGLAVVYLHGGAWYGLDKDVGTRPLFRHLAAQGHVVVDVAYRLFPETDLPGMVADAKRALAWVQHHAADLQIRPDRIVVAGGSAGGHLALLAAYTHHDPALTPAELAGSDPSVCGVVSLYGQADLAAHYDHTSQQKVCRPDDPRPDWDAPTTVDGASVRPRRRPTEGAEHGGRPARLAGRRDPQPGPRPLRLAVTGPPRPPRLPTYPAGPRPTR